MDFSILDASAFYAGVPFGSGGRWQTTPQVLDEIIHIKKGHGAIEAIIATGRLTVREPAGGFVRAAARAATGTGDLQLSVQDMSVIALALETGGDIITDDFAISNVAVHLGIRVTPVMTGGIRDAGRWIHYCPGCKKNFRGRTRCPMCDSMLRKKLIKKRG